VILKNSRFLSFFPIPNAKQRRSVCSEWREGMVGEMVDEFFGKRVKEVLMTTSNQLLSPYTVALRLR